MGGFLPDSRRVWIAAFGAAVPCLLVAALAAEGQPGCLDCRAADQHVAFAAYYDLQSFEASLILNNKGPDVLPVQFTAFSLRGERLDLGEWELDGSSAVTVSLNAVLVSYPNRFRRGSLELRYRYDGCPLVLSAGLILEDRAAGVGFDEVLARPAGFASNRLEAVWRAPSSRARMELVVANRSEKIVTAAIAVRSLGAEAERRELEVTLGPRETRVVNVPRAMTIGEFGRQQWAAGSATVEHTGSPGDVIARGRMEDRAARYATVVEFSDPEAGPGNELHGTGLRLGRFEGRALVPTLVVRNTAEEPSEVTVRLPWTDEWGEAHAAELDVVFLEAGEVRELSRELLDLVGGLPTETMRSAGLELRYSTAPGTVLAAAQSVSLDGEYAFRVPLVDPLTKGSAGNYPLRLYDSTDTLVYLKNVTDQPRKYKAYLRHPEGDYILANGVLDPHQVSTFDIARLRDSREPDELGNLLPSDVAAGQIRWSVIGGDNHSMVGRAEYVDRAAGTVATFACSNCCPDSYHSGYITPGYGYVVPGGKTNFQTFERREDCYGTIGPWTDMVDKQYHTEHTYIAIVHPDTGELTGQVVGITKVIATYYVEVWYYHPLNGCTKVVNTGQQVADVFVMSVEILSADITNDRIDVRLRPTDTPAQSFTLQLLGPSGSWTIRQGSRSPGTYNETFNISALPTGEYHSVRAIWGIGSDTRAYHIRVLGDYNNTRYNIPEESGCGGSTVDFKTTGPGNCTIVANCDMQDRTGKSGWLAEVLENGSGYHSTLEYVTREWHCQGSGPILRDLSINWGCPKCPGEALVTDGTVAVNPSHPHLTCGDRVFVVGVGERTVTDTGGLVQTTQLDHFAGKGACNSVFDIGTRKAIKLF